MPTKFPHRALGCRRRISKTKQVSYAAAEITAGRLADDLRSHLGDALSQSQFVAIPRGGLFVLGFLSYLLDLKPMQIRTADAVTADRVVVVDDCALSGARLAAVFDRITSTRLLAAVLAAPPPLEQAAVAAEARLESVLVGEPIAVRHVPESAAQLPGGLAESLSGRRYWLGETEPIAFPWSEPEGVFPSRSGSGFDDGWRRLSPIATLRGRAELGIRSVSSAPRYQHPDGVLWRWDDDGVMFWHAETDRVSRLDATGVTIWRGLLCTASETEAVECLVAAFEVEAEVLAADMAELESHLVASGLLRASS